MKNVALIALILCVTAACGCNRAEKAQQKKREAENQNWHTAIDTLTKKYDAVSDWESIMPDRGKLGPAFSIDISRALMPTNGRPILLVMELKDIEEKNGSCSAKFESYLFEKQSFHVLLDIKCTSEMAERLLGMSKGEVWGFERYAVIAKIREVSRVTFKIEGTTEGAPEGESPELEVDYSPDTFIAKGTLVDLIHRDEQDLDKATNTKH